MFRQNLNCRVWSKARSIIYCFLVPSPSHLCKSANHEHGFGGCEEVLEMRTYVFYVNWQCLYLQLMMLALTLAIVRNFTQPRSQGWGALVPQSTMDPTIPASTWISIPTSVRAVLSRLIWNSWQQWQQLQWWQTWCFSQTHRSHNHGWVSGSVWDGDRDWGVGPPPSPFQRLRHTLNPD